MKQENNSNSDSSTGKARKIGMFFDREEQYTIRTASLRLLLETYYDISICTMLNLVSILHIFLIYCCHYHIVVIISLQFIHERSKHSQRTPTTETETYDEHRQLERLLTKITAKRIVGAWRLLTSRCCQSNRSNQLDQLAQLNQSNQYVRVY